MWKRLLEVKLNIKHWQTDFTITFAKSCFRNNLGIVQNGNFRFWKMFFEFQNGVFWRPGEIIGDETEGCRTFRLFEAAMENPGRAVLKVIHEVFGKFFKRTHGLGQV